jgi:hypothetical protein
MVPVLYMSEMGLPEEDIRGFLQWFGAKHAPDLYESGFLTCTAYRAVQGDMTIFDMYTIPSWETLSTSPYKDMIPDDGAKYYGGRKTDGSNTIYDQVRIDEHVPEKCTLRTLEWISLVRFDGDLDAVEAALQANDKAFRDNKSIRVRYARRGKAHPKRPTHRPAGICIIECEDEDSAVALNSCLLDAMPAGAEAVSTFIGWRAAPWSRTQVHGD